MGAKNIKGVYNRQGLIGNFLSGKTVSHSANIAGGDAATLLTTGGTLAEPGNGFRYHFFTSTSTPGFEVQRGEGSVDYLIIGGGGAGGSTPDSIGCGGGGAGGFLTGSVAVTPGSYPITIGAGGAYQSNQRGQPGLDSSIAFPTTLTASGGGGGGGRTPTNGSAQVGGSGGGASGYDPPLAGASGNQYAPRSPLFPAPAPGQGNNGGNGTPTGDRTGGGGGGAGSVGANGTSSSGGAGGDGLPAFNLDTGIPTDYGTIGPTPGRYFAGGGGGGQSPPGTKTAGDGGAGGGGDGGAYAGTVNTGGGGGGANVGQNGGNGGSGIVIIRYAVKAL